MTEEVEEINVEDVCLHPLDELFQNPNGFWLCSCGASGTLGTDELRKLVFIPQRFTLNRADRRRLIRDLKRNK